VDIEINIRAYRAYFRAVNKELIESGHDLAEGGLAVAVAESCIAGDIGADIDLGLMSGGIKFEDEELLFSESTGRILVSVSPANEKEFRSVFRGIPCMKIGRVNCDGFLRIRGATGEERAVIPVNELTEAYRGPLFNILGMRM
jgi:phosphoribosylformylglycinamidine synthase